MIVPIALAIYMGYHWFQINQRQAKASEQRVSNFARDLRAMRLRGASDRELCGLAREVIADMTDLSHAQTEQARAVVATYCDRSGQ